MIVLCIYDYLPNKSKINIKISIHLSCMLYRSWKNRTPSGDRRKTLQRTARELARDARALQKAAHAPSARQEAERLQGEADAALAEAEALKL